MKQTTIGLLFLSLLLFQGLAAGQYVFTAASVSGVPGAAVVVPVTLDNPQGAHGFSMGLSVNAAILELVSAEQGAVVASANGGTGADYFFVSLDQIPPTVLPPDVTIGCVISLAFPLETIPPGLDNEIVLINYNILPGAAPGSSSAVAFTDTLGDPPVTSVVSVGGVTMVPAIENGQVDVITPPVTDLTCEVTDICVCEFTLSWLNGLAYDSMEVYQDGILVASLPGSPSFHVVTTGAPGPYEFCVVGVKNGAPSASTCCNAECLSIPPLPPPDQLACNVDPVTCEATMTWVNPTAYAGVDVFLDGVLVQSLPGSAQGATVLLPDLGVIHNLCVHGVDDCGLTSDDACCPAECPLGPEFVRGDGNSDGGIDISDPIWNLTYQFSMGQSVCLDAQDVNDSGAIDLADPVFNLTFIFNSGPQPPSPYPLCGVDPTDTDPLGCDAYTMCP
ncbi:MAG: hypothetical protein ACE5GW_03655 [Planctomycetota bacterium]